MEHLLQLSSYLIAICFVYITRGLGFLGKSFYNVFSSTLEPITFFSLCAVYTIRPQLNRSVYVHSCRRLSINFYLF